MIIRKPKRNDDSLHLVESTVKSKNGDDGVKTWSTAIQILLPVAALAILWGQRGFFARFFLQFDKNCVAVFCPSLSKRQRLLKWASGRLPQTWSCHSNIFLEGPAQFWRDGSLLCTLINSAIPGACSNPHRHWRQPPSHGQALAYKYLGIAPVFTETELSENALNAKHERLLLDYLLQVQQAITKLSVQEFKFCSNYITKGMGLVAAEQNRKATFYIYSNTSKPADAHDVIVSIRGPYSSYSDVTIPVRYVVKKSLQIHMNERKRLTYQSNSQKSFFRSLSVDFGSFINTGQKQNLENEIPVKLITEKERVKVVYIAKHPGIHEVSVVTNGFHLKGSPFTVNVAENTSNKIDTFDECEKLHFKRSATRNIRRRIISRIIDFIDEKVTYDALRSIPIRTRSIPQINIVQSKETSDDNPKISEANTNDTTDNNLTDKNVRTDENHTTNNLTTPLLKPDSTADETKSTVTKPSLFSSSTEPYKTKTQYPVDFNLSDLSLKTDAVTKEILETSTEISPTNDPNNNNTCGLEVFDASSIIYLKEPVSLAQSSTITSPLCESHTEKEVSDGPMNFEESSEIPGRNLRKTTLKKQNKIDILDEPHEFKSDQGPEETTNLVREEFENESTSILLKESNLLDDRSSQNRSNEDFNKFPEINSMHILNFLSSLKSNSDVSEYETLPSPDPSETKSNFRCPSLQSTKLSIFNEESNFNRSTFKKRLQYWESHTNLDICEERPRCKHRRSLPNIFSYSCTGLVFFPADDDDLSSTDFDNFELVKNKAMHQSSIFQERQQYWRALSSQTVSYSSLSGSLYHLENKSRYLNKNRIRARRSLPNLFSTVQREEVYREINYLDFYNSPDVLQFKARFKECREYWERLSTQNLNYEDSGGTTNGSFTKLKFDDNFDSGFYNSMPNLLARSYSQSPGLLIEDPESLKFKFQYKERQEYWEKLSSSNLSLNKLSSVQNQQTLETKRSETKNNDVRRTYVENKMETVITEPKQKLEKLVDNIDEGSLYHDEAVLNPGKDRKGNNLTDDVKSITDQREKMRIHFYQARQYFKGLEDDIKQ